MTPEQVKGTQFELWLEMLLARKGYHSVLRDVHYHKGRHVFRQIDVQYETLRSGRIITVIIEAKYTSNGVIHNAFRDHPPQKARLAIPRIETLVQEVYEKVIFTRAQCAVLVTNGHFDESLHTEAKRYGISCVEQEELMRQADIPNQEQLEKQMRCVDIASLRLPPHRVYIR